MKARSCSGGATCSAGGGRRCLPVRLSRAFADRRGARRLPARLLPPFPCRGRNRRRRDRPLSALRDRGGTRRRRLLSLGRNHDQQEYHGQDGRAADSLHPLGQRRHAPPNLPGPPAPDRFFPPARLRLGLLPRFRDCGRRCGARLRRSLWFHSALRYLLGTPYPFSSPAGRPLRRPFPAPAYRMQTLRTSLRSVSPAMTLTMPSCRSVFIPCAIDAFRRASIDLRLTIRCLISSVASSSS